MPLCYGNGYSDKEKQNETKFSMCIAQKNEVCFYKFRKENTYLFSFDVETYDTKGSRFVLMQQTFP